MTRKTVALNEDIINDLNLLAKKEHRYFSSALRYTLRIGLLAIENPELTVREIKDILDANADYEIGNLTELSINDI